MNINTEDNELYETRLKKIEEYFNFFPQDSSVNEIKEKINEATLILMQDIKLETEAD